MNLRHATKRTIHARFFTIVNIMIPESNYKAYILRVWQVVRGGHKVVVASLENSHANQHIAFASLPALLTFLENEAQEETQEVEIKYKSDPDGFYC